MPRMVAGFTNRLLKISKILPVHQFMIYRGSPEKSSGVFKQARPARPQPIGRGEHALEYVSTAKGRERRWRLFSTLPTKGRYKEE